MRFLVDCNEDRESVSEYSALRFVACRSRRCSKFARYNENGDSKLSGYWLPSTMRLSTLRESRTRSRVGAGTTCSDRTSGWHAEGSQKIEEPIVVLFLL